jgi:hypothetical protein
MITVITLARAFFSSFAVTLNPQYNHCTNAGHSDNRLRIATYNIDGLDASTAAGRCVHALNECMRPVQADIICLQEVTADNRAIIDAFAERNGYQICAG